MYLLTSFFLIFPFYMITPLPRKKYCALDYLHSQSPTGGPQHHLLVVLRLRCVAGSPGHLLHAPVGHIYRLCRSLKFPGGAAALSSSWSYTLRVIYCRILSLWGLSANLYQIKFPIPCYFVKLFPGFTTM